jgi:hypothetical protein
MYRYLTTAAGGFAILVNPAAAGVRRRPSIRAQQQMDALVDG